MIKMYSLKNYCYQYTVDDWANKKAIIKKWLNNADFQRDEHQCFLSDRATNNDSYKKDFSLLFRTEIENFANELGRQVKLKNLWMVKYEKEDWHPPHTHGSTGYSGIMFVEYDDKEHTAPYFIDTVTDSITDKTHYMVPIVFEGDIIILRSNILHFTYPNKSDKERIILGFDIEEITVE